MKVWDALPGLDPLVTPAYLLDTYRPLLRSARILSTMPARFDGVPLPISSASPFPTRIPTHTTSLKRGKTLTRPERHVAPVPLIAPPTHHFADDPSSPESSSWSCFGGRGIDWWTLWSYATTWWAPPALLKLCGIKEKQSRQAWREKITLCWIAIILGSVVGFFTMGLQRALCPAGQTATSSQRLGTNNGESGSRIGESDCVTSEKMVPLCGDQAE